MKNYFKSVLLAMLCLVSGMNAGFAQTGQVTGTVTDGNGPLAGAVVSVAGSSTVSITDVAGRYSISAVPDAMLEFSLMGFATQRISVEGRRVVDVLLQSDLQAIDEVVVVGYGVQKKVNLTGSVASLSADDLVDRPVANISQALAGLAPGLSVLQTSGRPGTGAEVRLRGTGTFSRAGTEPLVLVDGLAASIDDVDPDNVQSISFLKDAASASIYGNRAANGVILIETKKGATGDARVTYSGSVGWQSPTELPDFLPSWEYATLYNESRRNIGQGDVYTAEEIAKFKNGSDPDNYPDFNHMKWLLESGSGFQQRHTVSAQGGNDNLSYNVSAGYWNQKGMTAETSNERYSAVVNLTAKLLPKLTLSLNNNAYTNHYRAPRGTPGDIDGMIGFTVRHPPTMAGQRSDGTYGYQENYGPMAWLATNSHTLNRNFNLNSNSQLAWETPVTGLSVIGRLGIRYRTHYNKDYMAIAYFDENKSVGPNSLNVNSGQSTFTSLEGLLTYNRDFGKHSINALAGTSREMYSGMSINGYRRDYPNDSLYELDAGTQSTQTNGGSSEAWALISFFGRVNYDFADRYLFEANIRYDGSSRFPAHNRWGLFPSFSAGWRVSEENFWKDSGIYDVVSNFKIRASWGVLGNQNIGTYPYQNVFSLGQNYPMGNPLALQNGARINNINNSDITWETTAITDFGVDLTLFNGKLDLVFDYFYKYTDNILSAVQVSNILGKGVGQSNVGAVSNKGIEIALTYRDRIGKDFRFSIAPNFTYIKNAVEVLANGAQQEINNGRFVGHPLGIIYGYRTDGLFVDQEEINSSETQLTTPKPGYIKLLDQSGDNRVTANDDRVILGSTTPKFYYGLNLSMSWKGFDVSALLQGIGGHKRLIGNYMAYAFYNGGQIQRWQADSHWSESNPDKWAEHPRLEPTSLGHSYNQTSDYWMRDASFLRVKNVTIGYTIPKNVLDKVGMERARIYVSGQNLHSFNAFYQGWDPENQIGTGDAPSFYPINAIWSVGLNLTF
jgi:TonB-linked SusC/RagA family outer membrane protein